MATTFEVFGGVQPWEEQQSPSPTHEASNPYDALPHTSASPPSPIAATTNSLHRQLSGDPEHPPPAWRRRSSTSTHRSATSGLSYNYDPNGVPSSPRRHHPPGLMMTARVLPAQNGGGLIHDTPEMIAGEFDLPLPQPSFRRRTGGASALSSNRSSYADGLNSEELWALDSGDDSTPDASNPMRSASERPLDTIRRMSQRVDHAYPGIPQELIWPAAPPVDYQPPAKSKSFTHVPSISRRGTKRMSKRDSAAAITPPQPNLTSKSAPISPVGATDAAFLSSANSSVVSLTSHPIPVNKSQTSLKPRPASLYYSRDFLSGLAPREGGYAIAAQMGTGFGSPGSMGGMDDRRRSSLMDQPPRMRPNSRAPMAKSAGMGRWSLDGGEEFNKKVYTTSSAATTSSNLSTALEAEPIEELAPHPQSRLPEGASPAQFASSVIPEPSIPAPVMAPTTPAPQPNLALAPTSSHSPYKPKSKKELAKEAKATAKAEAALAKQKQREAEIKAKEDAKRKEKEDKERRKAEKAEKKAAGSRLKSPSQTSLASSAAKKLVGKVEQAPPVPAVPSQHQRAQSAPMPVIPAITPAPSSSSRPFPQPASQSVGQAPVPAPGPAETRKVTTSMPANIQLAAASKPAQAQKMSASIAPKRGFLGTIKKRFSVMAIDSKPQVSSSASPIPSRQAPATVPAAVSAPAPVPTLPPVAATEEIVVIDASAVPEATKPAADGIPSTEAVIANTEPGARLPARSSSLFPTAPTYIPDTPSFRRSNSHANDAASPPMSFPTLSKAVSHDANAPRPTSANGGNTSPSPSPRRLSGFGPRPMVARPSSTSTSSPSVSGHLPSSTASTDIVTPSITSSAESTDAFYQHNHLSQSNSHSDAGNEAGVEAEIAGKMTPSSGSGSSGDTAHPVVIDA